MQEKVDFRFLVNDTRSRVYLLWAAICIVGFIATHYVMRKEINGFWALLSLVGLVYMWRVMPLRIGQMRRIFAVWFVTIFIGMLFSALAFRVENLYRLSGFLGSFWLLVMAVGYVWNGFVDRPMFWYVLVGLVNVVFALFTWRVEALWLGQYLIAAVVSGWSMLMLWVFRT